VFSGRHSPWGRQDVTITLQISSGPIVGFYHSPHHYPMTGRPFWNVLRQCFVGTAFLIGAQSIVVVHSSPRDFAVEITAAVSDLPPQITLSWRPDARALSYSISRKTVSDGAWTPQVTVNADISTFTDTSVIPGIAYEYQIIKTSSAGYTGYGYICSGIRRDMVDFRGKVILLIEQGLGQVLAAELARLQQDLVGDGWAVLRHDVGSHDAVSAVKEIVRADYQSDPDNVKALFLFGHIPVPYSGDLAPDGHPNHKGAWPADVYYAEFSGEWTDTAVNSTAAADSSNWNVPGDGKFDQSTAPGLVRLEIGRVDLSNLTCYSNKTPSRNELDLARQYLQKDHNFRHGLLNVERRALIYDNRGTAEPDPLSAMAWRMFPGFVGSDHITEIGANQYFSTLENQSYLWSFTCSGADFVGSDLIGSSDDFARNNPHVVFTSFIGSYFGDWNRESSFLRAPLGTSGYILTSIYGGQPQWILHTMALGDTVGHSAFLTQNNSQEGSYPPHNNYGVAQVHIDLMGDPTLRMYPVKAPAQLAGGATAEGWRLSWNAVDEQDLAGYRVYRSSSMGGHFERISGRYYIPGTSFVDTAGGGQFTYMVRAVKLEHSPSGTFFNPSQGVFFPDVNANLNSDSSIAPIGLSVAILGSGTVNLGWYQAAEGSLSVLVERRELPNGNFQQIAELGGAAQQFIDSTVRPSITYAYRVRTMRASGPSDYSDPVSVNLQSGSATFIKVDPKTQGRWPGIYGQDGYLIVSGATNLPSYAQIDAGNASTFVSSWSPTNTAALMRPDSAGRISACWYGQYRADLLITLRFLDQTVHRTALYFYDDPSGLRNGHVEVSDPVTGQLLSSQPIDDYGNGKYLVFDILGAATIKVIPGTSGNAILNGIFFSTPPVDKPIISPGGGLYPGRTTVDIVSTPGAAIHFTLDGSLPDSQSPVYSAPIDIRSDTVIKARAFKNGYITASEVSSAAFTNSFKTDVKFVSVDLQTEGNWPGQYGQEAFWVMGGDSKVAPFVEFDAPIYETFQWSDSTTEARAIRKSPNTAVRLASCWASPDQISFDLVIYDKNVHPIALYFMDWDKNGRVEDVTILDGDGKMLDQRRVSGFENGVYLVWNAKGSIRITIKNVAGNNAILNGLFVGSAIVPVISTEPAILFAGKVAPDGYHLRIIGKPGQTFTLEASDDCIHWSSFATGTLSETNWDIIDDLEISAKARMYRARLVP
jgi:hypothetical protein